MPNPSWRRPSHASDADASHSQNKRLDRSSSLARPGASPGVADASKVIKKPRASASASANVDARSRIEGAASNALARAHGASRMSAKRSSSSSSMPREMENIFDLTDADAGAPSTSRSEGRARETDGHKLKQRQRQIDYGKNTLGYARYCELVKRATRKRGDAWTPDINAGMSKRAFDGCVRKWRRMLHEYDPAIENNEDVVAVPVDPHTRPEGTLKPGEYVPEALALAARRRAEAKAVAEAAVREGRHIPVEKLAPLRAGTSNKAVNASVALAASLPTHVDMSPGWSAITPTPREAHREQSSRFDVSARQIFPRTPAAGTKSTGDVDMMDCDVDKPEPRSIYDDWEGEDFAGVV